MVVAKVELLPVRYFQMIIDDKKRDRKSAKSHEARLKDENDRQRQKMIIKDDEIKDLRQKCLKLELEVKEKNQRESEVQLSIYYLEF